MLSANLGILKNIGQKITEITVTWTFHVQKSNIMEYGYRIIMNAKTFKAGALLTIVPRVTIKFNNQLIGQRDGT